jgi:HK97 family phage prohead protease
VERRDYNFKIKSLSDEGTFQGLAAAYGNVDLGGDVIEPGAFAKSIASGKAFPLLWQHQPDNPIGTVKVSNSRDGLFVDGTLMMSDPTAQKAHTFMKSGVVKGLSIGYDVLQEHFDNAGIRHLTEVKLWEVSAVTFPMNESAQIFSVKGRDATANLAAAARFIKSVLAVEDDEARGRIQEIAAHCKTLLGEEDDDLIEDADDECDPEVEKALGELRTLVAQVRELHA